MFACFRCLNERSSNFSNQSSEPFNLLFRVTKRYNKLLCEDSRAINCYGLHQQNHCIKGEIILSRVDVDNNFWMTSSSFSSFTDIILLYARLIWNRKTLFGKLFINCRLFFLSMPNLFLFRKSDQLALPRILKIPWMFEKIAPNDNEF